MCGLCFWASDPLIDRFYWNLSIKGSEAQNKSRTNVYECCKLTKKYILTYIVRYILTYPGLCFNWNSKEALTRNSWKLYTQPLFQWKWWNIVTLLQNTESAPVNNLDLSQANLQVFSFKRKKSEHKFKLKWTFLNDKK